jgi:hypothetical protein
MTIRKMGKFWHSQNVISRINVGWIDRSIDQSNKPCGTPSIMSEGTRMKIDIGFVIVIMNVLEIEIDIESEIDIENEMKGVVSDSR